jgi:NADH dehydrogenase FAD-containing subunit
LAFLFHGVVKYLTNLLAAKVAKLRHKFCVYPQSRTLLFLERLNALNKLGFNNLKGLFKDFLWHLLFVWVNQDLRQHIHERYDRLIAKFLIIKPSLIHLLDLKKVLRCEVPC